MSMERDPQNPLPPRPGGRALDRLRQFEEERGLEPSPELPPGEEADAPLPGAQAGEETGESTDEPPGGDAGG